VEFPAEIIEVNLDRKVLKVVVEIEVEIIESRIFQVTTKIMMTKTKMRMAKIFRTKKTDPEIFRLNLMECTAGIILILMMKIITDVEENQLPLQLRRQQQQLLLLPPQPQLLQLDEQDLQKLQLLLHLRKD